MPNKLTVYVAGRYRARTWFGIWLNIFRAWRTSKQLWRLGFAPLCPHANSLWMSEPPNRVPASSFLGGDLALMRHCDYVLFLPGWQTSSGARGEWHYAKKINQKVVYSIDELLDKLGKLEVPACIG